MVSGYGLATAVRGLVKSAGTAGMGSLASYRVQVILPELEVGEMNLFDLPWRGFYN